MEKGFNAMENLIALNVGCPFDEETIPAGLIEQRITDSQNHRIIIL